LFFPVGASLCGCPHNHSNFIDDFKTFPLHYALSKKETYEKVIADLKNGYRGIHPDLFKAYADNLRKAVGSTMNSENYGDKYFEIQQRLNANVMLFAAYKACIVTRELDRQRADDNGEVNTDDEYKKRAKAVLNTFNRYQVTEYNTAVARSVTAQQWTDFNDDPEMNRLYPNLKWIPSRSATQREEHRVFYGLVLPKTDPFWQQNQPGNLWNCKCDWEQTDEPADKSSPKKNIQAKGLEGNPGITGEIFTKNASYFKAAPKENTDLKQADERYKKTLLNLKKYLAFDNEKWEHGSFTEKGGYLVLDKERIKKGAINKQENAKFEKEKGMCETLANGGYAVEFIKEIEGRYDALIDKKPAELKSTKSHNNILGYAKKAIQK
jgi:hypothetical protein